MADKGWNSIPVPDGFVGVLFNGTPLSFISWMATAQIHVNSGSKDVNDSRQPFFAGKARATVEPDRKGGTVSITVKMKYKLGLPADNSQRPLPKVLEQDDFVFGCKWEYSFSQLGQLSFGPAVEFTIPEVRGHKVFYRHRVPRPGLIRRPQQKCAGTP